LKRHAVLLARGEANGDVRDVNLNDYSVRLYYTDPEGDKIFLYSDLDVQYATRLRTTTVKITAKVDDAFTLMTATPSTTETAIPTTTETGTPQPAAT
jgi:catechol-2,3-dioxygenase